MKVNNVQREVEELLNYAFTDEEGTEKPIVVVGPDGKTKTKLRVYAYGGCIGRIATRACDNNRLAESENYEIYLKKAGKDYLQFMVQKYPELQELPGMDLSEKLSGKLKEMLSLQNGKKTDELLLNLQYLDFILKAAKIRFTNPREDEYERKIQTEIVKKHLDKKLGDGWCIVDMEFAISEKDEDTDDKQIFKPDIVVLDKEKGFGLIELKYQNKNTENLSDHYSEFVNAANDSDVREWIIGELKRRCGFLLDYELMNRELYEISQKPKSLWRGFLFVGGEKGRSADLVKQMAVKHPEIKDDTNCQFWWFPEDDLDSLVLRFDPAHTYQGFMQ